MLVAQVLRWASPAAGSVRVVLESGAGFAGYRLERVLGQGGMGTVYLAEHPRLPRSVALKLLNREFSADQELQRRFEREADVVAQLDHPSIVGVYDRGSDDGYLWIAMQFIRGTDAASWDSRAHEPGVTARLIGETASALDYANQHGVLHRDVKPGNILIADPEHGREIRAVLTDFGIARVATADTQLTATGTFTATLAYASPEQLSGELVDHRSDQYSLACTLFAMYAGHPPYTATNPGQVVAGHLSQPVPRLTTIRQDLPPAVDGVIARAMAKRRDERFGSATEFTDVLRDALEGRHIAAPTVRQPWTDHAPHAPGSGEHAQPPWRDPAQQWHGSGGRVQQPVPLAYGSDGYVQQPIPSAHGSGGHGQQPVPLAHGSGGDVQQPAPLAHVFDGHVQQPVQQAQGSGGRVQQPAPLAHASGGQVRPGWVRAEYGVPVGDPRMSAMAAGGPWHQTPVGGPEPSKAAAFFVGIVTLLVSLSIAAFLVYGVTQTLDEIDRGKDPSGSFIAIAVLTVLVAFTGSGAVLLLCARTVGRVMSIITAVLVGLFALFGVIGSAMGEVYAATAATAAVFVLAAALVGFAASPSTGRWIRYRKAVRASRWR
ncbi:protein kinase domain-containing protein [Nocardia fluminea]|uniref:protein kinase domain-containing protein n=1 Tax=Nocardia fluminea TaxID=134984 RepID=UPI0037B4918E